MAYIAVDFQKILGPIKPMHAVGQPPFAFRFSLVDEEHFLTEVDASPARFVLRAHQVALWKSGV